MSEWEQQKELYVSFKKQNTAKEVQSVILIPDIVTRGTSLNLLYMKVDFLRGEDESLKVGMIKENSSHFHTHRYKRENTGERASGETRFQLEHEGEGNVSDIAGLLLNILNVWFYWVKINALCTF